MDKYKKQMGYNYSKRKDAIEYIVVHDTGNTSVSADAKAHFNYFNGANRGSSADIFIDDHSAWYVNDFHRYFSWHCGDGKGRYGITNANSVGVEICINSDGDYEQAFSNAIVVVTELMKELNIPVDKVVRHYDASGKLCPKSMYRGDWERWKSFKEAIRKGENMTGNEYQELKEKISGLTETVNQLATEVENIKNPMIYNYIDDNMPAWARPTIEKLVEKGVLKGNENGLNLNENLMRTLVIMDRMNYK